MKKSVFFLMCLSMLFISKGITVCSADEDTYYSGTKKISIQESFWSLPEQYLQQKKEITYNLSKSSAVAEDIPFDVEILGKKDLTNTPARNVPEALQNLPSVIISPGGDFIQPSVPSVLGADSTYTKVLVDGIELNTQLDGTVDLSFFGLGSVQKIEVSKGPLSSLWGSGVGGVIYIQTKDPQKENLPAFEINTSYGSYKTYITSFSSSLPLGEKGSIIFTPEFAETNGYMAGGESRRKNIFLKGTYNLTDIISLDLTSGYVEGDIGEYEQPRLLRKSELDTHYFYSGLKINYLPDDSENDLKASLFINGFTYDTERRFYLLGNQMSAPFSINTAEENRLGVRGSIELIKQENIFSFEGNIDTSKFESISFPDEKDATSYYVSTQIKRSFKDNLSGSAYIRYDGHTAFDNEFSFGAGLSLKDISGWNVRVLLSRDFNAPPLNFRYVNLPERFIKSNSDLNSETAVTFRLSFEKQIGEKLLFQASPYYQKLENGILLTLDSDEFYFYKNHDSITRQGIEANFLWNIFSQTVLRAGASFNDIINEETDEVVEGNARLKYTVSLEVKDFENWIINLSSYYVWWNMPEFYNAKGRNFVFNAKITRTINEDLFLYASIYNITDEDLYWIDVLPNPPRHYEAGLTWRF